MAVVRGIAERKRAEEALKGRETQYRTLFGSSPVGIVLTDGEKVIVCNAKEAEILGYEAQDSASSSGEY